MSSEQDLPLVQQAWVTYEGWKVDVYDVKREPMNEVGLEYSSSRPRG